MSASTLRTVVRDCKKLYGVPYSYWIKKIDCNPDQFSQWINGVREFDSILLDKLETAIDENNVFFN